MRIATSLALFVAAEAARCRIKCDSPFVKNNDECKCECGSSCLDYQTQNADDCSCTDKPCTPCEPMGEGTATAADFQQSAQPECTCAPAEGKNQCDAIYGGMWTTDADGADCPKAEEQTEGDGDMDGEGSGASHLVAGAMVLAATLLI